MKYFQPAEENKIEALVLFCLIKNLKFDQTKTYYETKDVGFGITVKKLKVKGNFLNIHSEFEKLKDYQKLQVFTNEVELALLCPDECIFLYKVQDDCEINNIDIVGQFVYVTESEICSPILKDENYVDNNYFVYFKEFVLKNKTHFSAINREFTMTYYPNEKRFEIICDEMMILELLGVNRKIALPYVLYILKNIDRGTEHFVENCKIEKIVKRKKSLSTEP